MNQFGLNLGLRRKLPLILQTEAAECGLACLAMVASYHGHLLDLPSVRQRCSLSLKGATLAQLMTVAGKLDLEGRPLRLELEHLDKLETL